MTTATGAFTEVDSFLDSGPNDRHFLVRVDQNDRATLRFGDGRNGLPPSGTVTVRYKTGGGTSGNVGLLLDTGHLTYAGGDPLAVAREVVRYAKLPGKPVLASWMGGRAIAEGEALLNESGIPTYRYPDAAVRVFRAMARHSENLKHLESPIPQAVDVAPHAVLVDARARGRILLTEAESKLLLADYGIPTVRTVVARSAEETVEAARGFGFPVVVKLHSETITHKTDVGGVRLNLKDADAVREAFEGIRARVAAEDFLGVTVQPMVRLEGYELILGASADAGSSMRITSGSTARQRAPLRTSVSSVPSPMVGTSKRMS